MQLDGNLVVILLIHFFEEQTVKVIVIKFNTRLFGLLEEASHEPPLPKGDRRQRVFGLQSLFVVLKLIVINVTKFLFL